LAIDVDELAKEAGLKVYDTALPNDWVDDVHRDTGFWPQRYGFVWCYDNARIGGLPYPLTDAAKILLAFYEVNVGRGRGGHWDRFFSHWHEGTQPACKICFPEKVG
jgi:hypothetical protein